jgi:hypothetical protein
MRTCALTAPKRPRLPPAQSRHTQGTGPDLLVPMQTLECQAVDRMGRVNSQRENGPKEKKTASNWVIEVNSSRRKGLFFQASLANSHCRRGSCNHWRLAEGEERDQKHSPLSSTPEGRTLQGSGFECRSGLPGRTLWCLGAPTRTCCGGTQGVKLRGQRRQPCQPPRRPLFCPRSARMAAASWGQARARRIIL